MGFAQPPKECMEKARVQDYNTISVIMRFHNPAMLGFLEEALFSLAIQDWEDVEPIVVLQNGTAELRDRVERMILRQPWAKPPRYQILCILVPTGMDGRSHLMNCGISSAGGRYLAFLDYDDVIYHHVYTTLVRQLKKGGCVVAIGHTRRCRMTPFGDHWYVETKDSYYMTLGSNRIDLFRDNFVAPHAYVLDRALLHDFPLYFDEIFCRAEDYDFLLRLCVQFEPDLSLLKTPVCEHRLRTDGSNTVTYWKKDPSKEELQLWEDHWNRLEKKKDHYTVPVPMRELMRLADTIKQLQKESTQLSDSLSQAYQSLTQLNQRNAQLEREHVAMAADWNSLHREHQRMLYRAARKTSSLMRRIPLLKAVLKKTLLGSWSIYRTLKQKLRGLVRVGTR